MAAPLVIMAEELTRMGRGDGVGFPAFTGCFWVTVMLTGVVAVLRTWVIFNKKNDDNGGELTAA